MDRVVLGIFSFPFLLFLPLFSFLFAHVLLGLLLLPFVDCVLLEIGQADDVVDMRDEGKETSSHASPTRVDSEFNNY